MEFKFSGSIFKNDPSKNTNNNPNYPTHSGVVKAPLSQLKSFVENMHWSSRTDLQEDNYLKEQCVPIKISGWQRESNGKVFLSISLEPHWKTMQAAIEAKEASELASSAPSVQDAAANLAKGTAGTVVQTQQDDIF